MYWMLMWLLLLLYYLLGLWLVWYFVLRLRLRLMLMLRLRLMLRLCWVFGWLWWQYWTYFMEDYLRFNLLLLDLIMKIILYCLYLSQFDPESYLILQVQSESYYFTQHYLSPDPSFYNCHLPVYNYPNINHTPCTNTTN